ncbi:uncharacterized protein LOC6612334 isoform X4 [Drosophila sechellia]|uniref:uncharacterized protein LOC6612334 isoform X4 n=1 Tax=Drosophila sechellia TaxID=7238 RepID=UPI0013DE3533|nr:uncharacterized protein LOC6612334 isoform X4 [Drosophila sechellia]
MLLKLVNINGLQHLFACTEGQDDETLTILFLHPREKLSYSETLMKHDYQQRLKTLNARVKFPEELVRLVLVNEDPLHVEQHFQHPLNILKLKYAMANTEVSLKWEWHLRPMDAAQFYSQMFLNTMSTASGLRDQIPLLLDIIQAKDKELNQYRTEGCQLRRVTVETKPFDLDAFLNEHKELLDCAAAYQKAQSIFVADKPSDNLTPLSSPCARDVAPHTPSNGYSASWKISSPKKAPRIRKRKALEINTNHMERKVMQRRSNPLIEYRSSQSSQETNASEIFQVEDKKNDLSDGKEPSTSSGLSKGWSAKLTKYELASQEEYAYCKDEDDSSKDEDASSKDADASSKDEDGPAKDEDASAKDEDAFSQDEDTSSKDEDASAKDEENTNASNAYKFIIKKVLDAIKNKRLEMKKAARILGVSYGTLYVRYREVYGCLKHPYSGTAFRNSGSTSTSQMGVQPRFDLGFRNGGVLPAQLELGKLKKDLSELWTRPQI